MIEPIDPPEPLEEEYRAWQEQNAPSSPLLASVGLVVKHMRDQIDYSRNLGDEDEADMVETYCVELESALREANG